MDARILVVRDKEAMRAFLGDRSRATGQYAKVRDVQSLPCVVADSSVAPIAEA